MKKIIILISVLLGVMTLASCAKKAPEVVQKVTEIEAGDTISLQDLVSTDPDVVSTIKEGTIETNKPGTYELIIIATKEDRTEEYKITYTVVDKTAPVITQNSIPSVKKGALLKFSDFITVLDNSGENLTSQLDLYMVDTSTVGDHEFECTIKDSSGNEGTLLIKYTVNNDAVPFLVQYWVPIIAQGYTMRVSEFIGATDESGEDFTAQLNALKMDTNTVGKHEVWVKVTDSQGNIGQILFKYTVVAPTVFVDGGKYYVNNTDRELKIGITFHSLKIVDTIGSLPDVEGTKYVVMDLSVTNDRSTQFDVFIFLTKEAGEPILLPRDITFSNGSQYEIVFNHNIAVDPKLDYQWTWKPGQTWRIYWYVEVSDSDATLPFEIRVPIGSVQFTYTKK